MRNTKTLLSTTCALLTILLLTACSFSSHNWVRAQKTINVTTDHVPGSALEVRSHNGRIEVVASAGRTDVSIEAKLYARGDTMKEAEERLAATTLQVSRNDDGTLVIQPVFPEPRRGGDGAGITIEVPGVNGATIETSNGSVHVYGLAGILIVDTSNGSIEVFDHDGDADLDTSNGSITVNDHVGSLRLDTSNGSVRIHNVNGPVQADTSNGSIEVTLHDEQSGPLDLDTSNGSITVRVGAGFAGVVRLDTSNGSVTVRDHLGRITSRTVSKNRGRIVVGAGGEPSRLDTSNGRIRFTISG